MYQVFFFYSWSHCTHFGSDKWPPRALSDLNNSKRSNTDSNHSWVDVGNNAVVVGNNQTIQQTATLISTTNQTPNTAICYKKSPTLKHIYSNEWQYLPGIPTSSSITIPSKHINTNKHILPSAGWVSHGRFQLLFSPCIIEEYTITPIKKHAEITRMKS